MKSETVLSALADVLGGGVMPVPRNSTVPEAIPDDGLAILRDGDPGEGEPQMSPIAWLYQHRAQLDVVVAAADEAARNSAMDALLTTLGQRIAANRTLGGLCDYVEAQAPTASEITAGAGAVPIKAVSVVIVLYYETSDPLA